MNLINKILRKILKIIVSELKIGKYLQNKDSISVLTYHGVVSDSHTINDYCFIKQSDFDEQMKYLSENFHVKNTDDAYLNESSSEKPVAVITFDDGFMNNFEYAFPILKKYRLPATIFLSTKFIDTDETIWFCRVIQIIESCEIDEIVWDGIKLKIRTNEEKRLASSKIQEDLKLKSPCEIDKELDRLCEQLNVRFSISGSPYQMLTGENIKEMLDSGLIHFGAHTHKHAILSRLSEADAKKEVMTSISEVERITGVACKTFAYPNGGINDYSESHKQLLKDLNVKTSFSMKDGLSSRKDEYLELQRLFVSSHINQKQFIAQVHGY